MRYTRVLLIVIVIFFSITGTSQDIVWNEVAPGVWKGIVGHPEAYDLLKAAGSSPAREGLTKMGIASFPLPVADIKGAVNDGKTSLRFPLEREEQLYGFGLNFQTVHQRGKILQLHMDHYGGKDNGRTHAPVPFYVSSKGYGVFINSARYIDVYAGTGVRKDSKNPPIEKDRNTDKTWSSRPYSDAVEIMVPAAGARHLWEPLAAEYSLPLVDCGNGHGEACELPRIRVHPRGNRRQDRRPRHRHHRLPRHALLRSRVRQLVRPRHAPHRW